MTADRWAQVKLLFDGLVDLPEPERNSALAQRCGADSELRSEVERLLALHSHAGRFLESIPTATKALRAQTSPTARMFAPGDLAADRFRITRFIGRGGMGEVYEATDQTAGIPVALKTIRSGLEWNAGLIERFRREVALARQVTHPNVCRVHEVFEHRVPAGREDASPILLLSMELLIGETLADRIKRGGPVSPEQACGIVEQIGAGLGAAHRGGIIHRDLKSSNVMLVRGRDAKLRAVVTDFGLAQHVAGETGAASGTNEPVRAGTPDYMAPEQLKGLPLGPPADIFAFGVLMYEMFTGQLPFPSASTIDDLLRRLEAPPAPPSALAPGLDPRWDSLVLRCLRTDLGQRFQSVDDLLRSLPGPKQPGRRAFILGGTLLGAAIVAGVWLDRGRILDGPPSIAVLPFTPVGSSERLAAVADGLADELINAFSHVDGIRILARHSSFRFRGETDLASAGTSLSARYFVTGTVREENGNLRLSVQLVEAPRRTVRWGESFERSDGRLGDLPALMVAGVLNALHVPLSPQQARMIDSRQTTSGEAFNWFLIGRRLAMTRAPAALLQSLEAFDKAIALDPGYALAMSEKAAALIVLSGNPGFPPSRHLPEAKLLASQALALSPYLAEAHLSLGAVEQRLHWNWEAALEQFREARLRNPGLAAAHHWLGGLLSNLGRQDEAIQELLTARNLDPISSSVHTALGGALLRAGRLPEAVEELELTIRMDPLYLNAYYLLSQAYSLQGKHEQAVSSVKTALEQQPGSPTNQGCLAYVLSSAGRRDEALALISGLESRWAKEYFPPYVLAQAHAGLGDYDKAAGWLRAAWDTRDPSLVILKVDPVLAPMRSRADYKDLLRRLRL